MSGWPSGARRILVTAVHAPVALAAAAVALASPQSDEAFFGFAKADAPAGARQAALYVDGRRVASQQVVRRRVVFAVPAAAGRHDLTVRFEPGGRAVAQRAWLLPHSAQTAVRPRSRDSALGRRLAALGRGYPGYAAFWVHDPRTGKTAGWNSDAPFPAASMVKLAVMIVALDRYGPRPERSAAWREIRDLAVWSSNLATNRLLARLGVAACERVLRRIGARSSTVFGPYRLGTSVAADTPRPLPYLTYRRTTAHDMGKVLFELHAAALGNRLAMRRTGLSRHEARVGLALLLSSSRQGDNAGILQPRMPAAQKHGWTTKVRHTGAVVYAPDGPRIVVLLTFRPDEVSLRASQELGARVLRLVVRRAR
jgi:beta-lactamase class A